MHVMPCGVNCAVGSPRRFNSISWQKPPMILLGGTPNYLTSHRSSQGTRALLERGLSAWPGSWVIHTPWMRKSGFTEAISIINESRMLLPPYSNRSKPYNANFAFDINIKNPFLWGSRLISKKSLSINRKNPVVNIKNNVKFCLRKFDISEITNVKILIDINIRFLLISGHFSQACGQHPHQRHGQCGAMPGGVVGGHRTSGHTPGQVGGIWARSSPLVSPTQQLGSGPLPGQRFFDIKIKDFHGEHWY